MGWRTALALVLLAAAGAARAAAPALTAIENRWLDAGWPALALGRQLQLPVDIVVLPQARPGDVPLAMGYVDGRCKLVLAMRGNPDAESTLAGIAPALRAPVVEAMVAHELGHCWRYVRGAWHTVPAGFADEPVTGDSQEIAALRRDMRETRREEGFADLVGLAWTLQRHPEQYAEVHAWFAQARADQPVPGAHHDTRAWLRLAGERSAFEGRPGENVFEQAWSLWLQGLAQPD